MFAFIPVIIFTIVLFFFFSKRWRGWLATQSAPCTRVKNLPLISLPLTIDPMTSEDSSFYLAVAHKSRFGTWTSLIRDHDGFSAFNGVLTVNSSDLFSSTTCERARTPDTHKPAKKSKGTYECCAA